VNKAPGRPLRLIATAAAAPAVAVPALAPADLAPEARLNIGPASRGRVSFLGCLPESTVRTAGSGFDDSENAMCRITKTIPCGTGANEPNFNSSGHPTTVSKTT
jgi:hypothetical protein